MTVHTGRTSILAVPNSALEKYGDFTFAYVQTKPHVYEERKVKLGRISKDYTEVIEGISLNDIVVTKSSFSLLGEALKTTL